LLVSTYATHHHHRHVSKSKPQTGLGPKRHVWAPGYVFLSFSVRLLTTFCIFRYYNTSKNSTDPCHHFAPHQLIQVTGDVASAATSPSHSIHFTQRPTRFERALSGSFVQVCFFFHASYERASCSWHVRDVFSFSLAHRNASAAADTFFCFYFYFYFSY